VTGVALIAFLALALGAASSQGICATLIIWLFVMRALMIVYFVACPTSLMKHQQGEVWRVEGFRLSKRL